MDIYEIIVSAYPELLENGLFNKYITLRDDSDDLGAYIEEWNYSKPIPEGMKVGKN